MNEPSHPALPESSDPAGGRDGHRRSRRRRHGFLAGLVLGALGAGLVGFAVGAAMPVAEAALAHRAFAGDDDGPVSIEEAREHAAWFVGFALHRLDATPEQERQVQDIVAAAIDEVAPLVKKHRLNRDQFRAVLTSATIDREAVEELRRDELAMADGLSRIVVEALADSAEVLTLAQRMELDERLARFHHHH